MGYGRTARQELRLEATRLLTRHHFGDGRWGWRARSAADQYHWRHWTVIKQRPKKVTWAKASGTRAGKVHAIRYGLTATHTSGEIVYLVVWQCGAHARSKPVLCSHPKVVCAGCLLKLRGQRDVPLETG